MLEVQECGVGDEAWDDIAGEVEIAGLVAVVVVECGGAFNVERALFPPGEGFELFEGLEAVCLEEVIPVKID